MPGLVNGSSHEGTTSTSHHEHTSTQRLTTLRDATSSVSIKTHHHGSSSRREINTIGALLDYIGRERLRRMPHAGSKWDKTLKWAAYFASQLDNFSITTEAFLSNSQEASGIIYSSCHTLLELGPSQALVLEQVFALFYKVALVLAFFQERKDILLRISEIHQTLANVFADVFGLVTDVTAQYSRGGSSTSTFAVTNTFGSRLTSIYVRKDTVSNALWSYTIHEHNKSEDSYVEIETIRSFLWCSDRVLRGLASSSGAASSRAELTCEWFGKHLTTFTRSHENLMIVAGKPGSGKSTLFNWIVERLSRVEASNPSSVLWFKIDADMPTQTSITAVVKGLLLQLLDLGAGNLSFYKKLAAALHVSTNGQVAETEQALFDALEVGLHEIPDGMIVIDGLDQLTGGESASLKLLERLRHISEKHGHVKSLVLSLPLTKSVPQKTTTFTIEASHVHRDIRHCIEEIIATTSQFRSMKHDEKEKVVSRLAEKADGSFIWAVISLELLKREKTIQGIIHALDTLPKSVNDAVKKLVVVVDIKSSDARSLLAWLLAAQRPLTLGEIKCLFEIDLSSCSRKPQRFSEIESDIAAALGSLVVIIDGTLRFRHSVIRSHFLHLASSVKDFSNTGDFPFMIKEAHYDLSTRCLAYTKLFVTTQTEPSFEILQENVLGDIFSRHVCFEYASTYWISHFEQSPMFEPSGKHKLVAEFQNCFPSSVLLALVEASTWGVIYAPTDYELALYIRQTILGKQKLPTLQTLIIVAKAYERRSIFEKATIYWRQAYDLTIQLLGEDHELVIRCISAYLKTSSTKTITEKNDTYTQRETMLRRILTVYKRTKGVSHDDTIKYTRMLAQLYTDTKQVDLAVFIYRALYSMYVQKYGSTHAETKSVYKTFEEVYEKSSKTAEIKKTMETNETQKFVQSVAVTHERKEKETTDLVEYYEKQGDTAKAESTLVDLWRSDCEKASSSNDTKLEKRKAETTLQYVRFLKRLNRLTEAQTILEGLWTEYRSKQVQSEAVANSMTIIGKEMKQFNLKQARSIFQAAHSYFERNKTVTSSEASEILTELQETTREIVESTHTTTTTKTVLDESTMSEILDSTISTLTSATSKTALSSIVKTCQQLTSLYALEGRWTECFSVCSTSLTTFWPYVVTGKGNVGLPAEFGTEAITIATRLGECLFHQHQIEQAEGVYVRIFLATKSTLELTDEPVQKTLNTVLDFYEQTFRDRKWIKICSELYEECKTKLGPSHALTLRTAHRTAEFCSQLRFPEAEHFWLEIYTALVKGDQVPVDAIIAAKNLLIIYERDARWESAEKTCSALWTTFVSKGSESKLTMEFVEKIYSIYFYILDEVKHAKHEELYKVTVAYKDNCIKVFGARNELSLKAIIQLAQVCERSEKYSAQAITEYEEACKNSTALTATTSSHSITQTITRSKQHLARLYAKQTSTIAQASSTSSEVFESSKSQYGWSDERTLSSARELVSIHAKSQSKESITSAQQILVTAVVETLVNERSSEKLTSTATAIAQSYIEINQKETAIRLVQELRRQIITGDYTSSKEFGVSMKGTDRRSYVFLIAFEQALGVVSKSASFSQLLAELVTESLLYQSYHESVSKKSEFTVIFEKGSKLVDFYQSKKRTVERERIFTELLEQFAISMQVSKTSSTLRSFFELTIKELHAEHYVLAVLAIVQTWILERTKEHRHLEAYEFAVYIQKFVRLHGGWSSATHVEHGLEISLYLLGRRGANKCGDAKIYQSLLEVSRSILKEVILAAKELDIHFIQMRIDLVNAVVATLGEQQNHIDLEWILLSLWESRQLNTDWSSETIVDIGRLLVEVRFTINKRDAAIHLAYDIIYNLRRVWGYFDATTLSMVHLLAELYTSVGEHTQAIQVHQEMLETTLMTIEEGNLSKDDVQRAASNVQTEMELLHRSYIRNGGWGKDKNAGQIKALYEQVATSIADEKLLSKTAFSVEKWSTKDKADERGVWVRPATFEFYKEASANDVKHENNLRITDGYEPMSPRRQNGSRNVTVYASQVYEVHGNGNGKSAA